MFIIDDIVAGVAKDAIKGIVEMNDTYNKRKQNENLADNVVKGAAALLAAGVAAYGINKFAPNNNDTKSPKLIK